MESNGRKVFLNKEFKKSKVELMGQSKRHMDFKSFSLRNLKGTCICQA